jgi:3-dehydrosphinganine reductase
MFFPNTMLTPGYEEECRTRPKITSKIEDGDQPSTAEEAAKAMVDGKFGICWVESMPDECPV